MTQTSSPASVRHDADAARRAAFRPVLVLLTAFLLVSLAMEAVLIVQSATGSSVAIAIGCFTSGSPANSFTENPGRVVISFAACSGASPANLITSNGCSFGASAAKIDPGQTTAATASERKKLIGRKG